MKAPANHFARPELARGFADELQGKNPLSDASNGLFLAGDRRTGKTQFLKFDLKPELERRNVLVLYVDLMLSKDKPDEVLAQVLEQAMQVNAGVIRKAAQSLGLGKLSMFGAEIDFANAATGRGLSIYQILKILRASTDQAIALIIDEAQHALTHEDGNAMMWSLKSARDQMKTEHGAELMLVMSGSHIDKLTLLLHSRETPFWGSQVRAMPRLGDDYVAYFLTHLRAAHPEYSTVRTSAVVQAFEQAGRRPQFLLNALTQARTAHDAANFERLMLLASEQQRQSDRDRFTQVYLALSTLEKAVLERLLAKAQSFKAFDAAALSFYAERVGKKVNAAQVQKAIDALRNSEEALIWRSVRGEYSVYDQALWAWYEHLTASRSWPPQ